MTAEKQSPQTNTQGDRKFCDFPKCGCSIGAAERCGQPPAPRNQKPLRVLDAENTEAGAMKVAALLDAPQAHGASGYLHRLTGAEDWHISLPSQMDPAWEYQKCWPD